jgi:hypothetical protein
VSGVIKVLYKCVSQRLGEKYSSIWQTFSIQKGLFLVGGSLLILGPVLCNLVMRAGLEGELAKS